MAESGHYGKQLTLLQPSTLLPSGKQDIKLMEGPMEVAAVCR